MGGFTMATMYRLTLLLALSSLCQGFMPPACPSSTPPADDPKNCTIQSPADPEFSSICKPGSAGHRGGAEQPTNRCGGQNYTHGGDFKCACCGEPLFVASSISRQRQRQNQRDRSRLLTWRFGGCLQQVRRTFGRFLSCWNRCP